MVRASWTTAVLLGFSFTTLVLEAVASPKSASSPKPPSSGSKPAPSSGSNPGNGGNASNPGAQFGFTAQGWKAFAAGNSTSSAEQYFKSMTPAQQAQAVKQFNASAGSSRSGSKSSTGSSSGSMASKGSATGSSSAGLLGNSNYSSALGGLRTSGSYLGGAYGSGYPSMPYTPSYGLGGYAMPSYGLGGLPVANTAGLGAPGSTATNGGAGYVDYVVQCADDVAVRVLRLPKTDQPYTPEQLKEFKGPDTALPGYGSQFDNVREGQTVRVNIARQRTDPADPSKVRWIPVRQMTGKLVSVAGTDRRLTLRVTTRNGNGKEVPVDADQVMMIVIVSDPS